MNHDLILPPPNPHETEKKVFCKSESATIPLTPDESKRLEELRLSDTSNDVTTLLHL